MQDCTIIRAVELFGDMLFRVCLASLRHRQDAEDAVQEVFLRCVRSQVHFESEEHAKAYLLRVAVNVCRDEMRHRTRHKTVSDEDLELMAAPEESVEVWNALWKLPEKYRVPLVLNASEGYSVEEISKQMRIGRETIKKRLQRGRKLLCKELGWSE